MKATFVYSEEEVLKAVLAHHIKKITFAEKNYLIDVQPSLANPKAVIVFVEDKPESAKEKRPKAWALRQGGRHKDETPKPAKKANGRSGGKSGAYKRRTA